MTAPTPKRAGLATESSHEPDQRDEYGGHRHRHHHDELIAAAEHAVHQDSEHADHDSATGIVKLETELLSPGIHQAPARPEGRRPVLGARGTDRALRIVAPLTTMAVLAVLWQRWATNADSIMIPSFTETASAFGALVAGGEIWSATLSSSVAAVLGFSLSALVGIPVGIAMGVFRRLERALDVYVNLLLVVPMAAIMPILIMVTGIGTMTRVTIVFLFTVPFMIVNTRAGVKSIDISLIEMARCFGASGRQVWGRVLIPGAGTGIAAGLTLGLTRAIRGVFVAELILVPVGIGGLVLEYRARFQGDKLYATVLFVILLSLSIFWLMQMVQRRLLPWCKPADAVRH